MYKDGDHIASGEIWNQLNSLHQGGLLTTATMIKCRNMINRDPVGALSAAVLSIDSSARDNMPADFESALSALGKESDNILMTFQNEPSENVEAKQYLTGAEMIVDIDPPIEFTKQASDSRYYANRGAGIDGFLESGV